MDPPTHLWRTWSPQSHASLLHPTHQPPISYQPPTTTTSSTATELQNVLAGRHNSRNRFLFFSDTLHFSLQFAAQKKSAGWTNIQVTCLNTATARDSTAGKVVFYHIPDLIKATGMPTRTNRDGEMIDYAGEWVAIDTDVLSGAGSSTAGFDMLLDRGLYSLSPELGLQAERRSVHLYSALKTLRAYCFGSGRSWQVGEMEMAIAVRLAAAFEGVGGQGMVWAGGVVQMHLVPWFLSMRKRDMCSLNPLKSRLISVDARPRQPVGGNGTSTASGCGTLAGTVASRGMKRKVSEAIDLTGDDDNILMPASKRQALRKSMAPFKRDVPAPSYSTMSFAIPQSARSPEIEQCEALMSIMEHGQLRLQATDLSTVISTSTLAQDRASWQAWFRESRDRDRGGRHEYAGAFGGVRIGGVEKERRYGRRLLRVERAGRRRKLDGRAREGRRFERRCV
ncbi:hypothetical protein LTR78_006966 [Recurvomyces mirabilis]|uniref:Uncharacterized protein n=1 Tax=Recurvomyces mirabilis TaxID=574656 RepID=A0AAE0WK09_9PEZI|nr:hypothetical protein LTR78_006966 [Recurvomyces mirabilis]KAK5153350.1 hypothetical protein LTS14_007519 [Recurvomyces mirabilis]